MKISYTGTYSIIFAKQNLEHVARHPEDELLYNLSLKTLFERKSYTLKTPLKVASYD